jgi:hypothetical protein
MNTNGSSTLHRTLNIGNQYEKYAYIFMPICLIKHIPWLHGFLLKVPSVDLHESGTYYWISLEKTSTTLGF